MYSSPLPPPPPPPSSLTTYDTGAPSSSAGTAAAYRNRFNWQQPTTTTTTTATSSNMSSLRDLPPSMALPPAPALSSSPSNRDDFVVRSPRRSSLLPASAGAAGAANLSLNANNAGAFINNSTYPASSSTSSSFASTSRPVVAPLKIPNRTVVAQPATASSPITKGEKRANPLEDLIYTEQSYVDDLSVIIKRVAGAWSRSNFPPPALDAMFRAIEAVYRINKTFLSRLNEIGPNPSSPKALGDLLMRWIDDLAPAYTRYASTYSVDFDLFEPIQSNGQLAPILAELSWPTTLPLRENEMDHLLLDDLFLLPLNRLSYYKRLYAKLLRSTVEGRSDHALLVGANDQLDRLLRSCEMAKERSVVVENGGIKPSERERIDARSRAGREALEGSLPSPPPPARHDEGVRSSGESSLPVDNSFDTSTRSSSATGQTSVTIETGKAFSNDGPQSPKIEDLERRLDPSRAMDIFTMLPKKCKLQMAPPSLPFVRSVRRSGDATISFHPLSDPQNREIVIDRAYIFLLTDLFLVCQRMTAHERSIQQSMVQEGEGPDFWLMYPPLAGKHLRVSKSLRDSNTLEVVIMKKETLSIRFADQRSIDEWKYSFEDAIAFGVAQPPSAKGRSNSVASSTRHGPPSAASFGPPSPVPDSRSSAWPSDARSFNTIPSPSSTSGLPQRGESPLPQEYRSSPEPLSNLSLQNKQLPPLRQLSIDTNARRFPESMPDRRAASAGGYHSRPPPPPPLNGSLPPVRNGGMPGYGRSDSPVTYDDRRSPAIASSPGFGPSPSSRGPSPIDYQYSSSPGNGRYSPHQPMQHAKSSNSLNGNGHSNYQNDFSRGLNAIPNRLVKSQSSGASSIMSTSTNQSSMYPEPPPPLPNKRLMPNGRGDFYDNGRLGPPSVSSQGGSIYRSRSADGLRDQRQYRMPSAPRSEDRSNSAPGSSYNGFQGNRPLDFVDDADDDDDDDEEERKRPEQTSVIAQMRCKVFLQHGHGQWKSLGTAKLKLFLSSPSGTKQLVVDSDKSGSKTMISTIVLTDGVERVGKTGVAIDLSDQGQRTGIVYMLQMKTEQAAMGLFDQLLLGSDRAVAPKRR